MQYSDEPMLEMFIFETSQFIEQLESLILTCEKTDAYDEIAIGEIFRIMHTIKGSAAMMMFESISLLAHSLEDLFYYIREEKPKYIDCAPLSDLILNTVDFLKVEIEKIKNGDAPDGNVSDSIEQIKVFLEELMKKNPSLTTPKTIAKETRRKRQYYIGPERSLAPTEQNSFKAIIRFQDGCEMENIRAFSVIHNLKSITENLFYFPEDIIDNDDSKETIRREGFKIFLKTDLSYSDLHELLMKTLFLEDLELTEIQEESDIDQVIEEHRPDTYGYPKRQSVYSQEEKDEHSDIKITKSISTQQNIISVSVSKLDTLMDLVGEMVIAEAMVIQNSDLKDLELDNFQKAARQLSKITDDIQDMVMSIRMVPLSITFHKMHRIVRDMCKRLDKEVDLRIIGEETEVDKNIIEHISDPLMHLVRNAIDHGIESNKDRTVRGKPAAGTVTIEAKNSGNDVLIMIKDDGRGLDKDKILSKARKNELLRRPEEEMTDKEIFNLILLPGFSTKENVSEFSGRGVGMDVVVKNVETVGGSVSVDSIYGEGSTITLKIPLTLAIIDGMNIKVGNSYYTIPLVNIKESLRPSEKDIISDPDGNEMVMVRGQCYRILRLYEIYGVKTNVVNFTEGIIIMIEQDDKSICLLADELLGQQQVVVKSLPGYIRRYKKNSGLAGCTLLGNGNISLILDVADLVNH